MRRLVFLLLALGLLQIAYAQVHCALEESDCDEARCELCHLSDLTPYVSGVIQLPAPATAFAPKVVQGRRSPLRPPVHCSRGRAPPQ